MPETKKSKRSKATPAKTSSKGYKAIPNKKDLEAIAASLSESAMRYHRLVENLSAKMLRYDIKMQKFVFLNSKKFWTGHTLNEWNDMSEEYRSSWIHPDDLDEYTALLQDWELSKKDSRLELYYRLHHKEGFYVWIKSFLYKEYSTEGEPVALVEISIDISEQKLVEQELNKLRKKSDESLERQSKELIRVKQQYDKEIEEYKQREQELSQREENFRNLISNSADGILVATTDHTILFTNKRVTKITGYNHKDLLTLTVKDLFPPAEFDNVMSRIEKRIEETESPHHFLTEIVRKNESNLRLELTALKTIWQGKPVNVFTMRDIEDRRIAHGKKISSMVRNAVARRHTFYEEIVSKNPAILKIFDILPTIADSDSSLLIMGESGTGKELIVRAIHNLSPRCDKPLITVNCSALPDTLIESELFGYKKGAFTDAKEDKPGRFAQAEGGTLFLDEIGDISAAMQVKLLRVLQEKTIEPLGSKESQKVNIRILTATNRDLDKMVKEEKFRSDLFYRIDVVRLVLPPLRERLEDIPFLIEHFIGKFRGMFGKDITSISPQALGILMNYHYPGNIRELENFIEHAFLLCRGDKILPEHLPDLSLKASPVQSYAAPLPERDRLSLENVTPGTMQEHEAELILASLKKNHWNRTAAAEELGIHRVTLNRKINKLGIKLPEFDGRSAYRNIA